MPTICKTSTFYELWRQHCYYSVYEVRAEIQNRFIALPPFPLLIFLPQFLQRYAQGLALGKRFTGHLGNHNALRCRCFSLGKIRKLDFKGTVYLNPMEWSSCVMRNAACFVSQCNIDQYNVRSLAALVVYIYYWFFIGIRGITDLDLTI